MRTLLLVLLLPAQLAAEAKLLDLIRDGDHRGLAAALKAGADANVKDAAGVPALTYAAVYSNVDDMRLLLKHGAKVNATDASGATALLPALLDIDKVRLLVESGVDVTLAPAGQSALAMAARLPAGDAAALLLLKKGAKPDVAFVRRAAVEGRLNLVRIGLDAGVDAKEVSLSGVAYADVIKLLVSRGAKMGQDQAVAYNAYFGSLEAVRTLVENGASLTSTDSRQRTAIHYAAGGDAGDPAIVKLLLEHGADPKAKDVRGDTALEWARFRGNPEVIRLLGGAPKHGEVYEVARGPLPPVRESVQRAMRLLEAAGPAFFKKNACISCHNQSIPQMASERAREKGIALDAKVTAAQIGAVTGVWSGHRTQMWSGECAMGGGRVATLTYGLVGLGAEEVVRDQTVSLAVHCLAAEQRANGSWHIPDLRMPLGMSPIKYTALGLRGLQLYPLPGRREEFASRVERARQYLESVTARNTQDLAFQILGLKWAGAGAGVIEPLAAKLAQLQREDGGWPQREELTSDAFSTAQAVWALHDGAGRRDAAWRRGAEYLRITQRPDGSWYVHSRGFGFQPYRDTGFPYGHDQWLSTAATGFAVIALAPLIDEDKSRAGR